MLAAWTITKCVALIVGLERGERLAKGGDRITNPVGTDIAGGVVMPTYSASACGVLE